MAKQKEDDRDVFEKALDYAVPVAGAYLGMKGGARILSGGKRTEKAIRGNIGKNRAASDAATSRGDARGAVDADRRARYDRDDLEAYYRNRVVGGGAGGFVGGSAAYGALENQKKKRRK